MSSSFFRHYWNRFLPCAAKSPFRQTLGSLTTARGFSREKLLEKQYYPPGSKDMTRTRYLFLRPFSTSM